MAQRIAPCLNVECRALNRFDDATESEPHRCPKRGGLLVLAPRPTETPFLESERRDSDPSRRESHVGQVPDRGDSTAPGVTAGETAPPHTPGPWEVEQTVWTPDGIHLTWERLQNCWWVRTPRKPVGGRAIALVDIVAPGESAEGNARLIAAAPDLLAALRMAERIIGEASLVPHYFHPERVAIRNAIAKALGAEPT